MNKIRNYWKNKKGITLVWGAFFLVLCLMFLGLAVDIAYMYVVKNQLHVAADSASLAGAATLTWEFDNVTLNPNVLQQEEARQQAWRFACRNTAGNESVGNPERRVYLVTNNPLSCDASLAGIDLNNSNVPGGDIVVGNWSATPRLCPSTGITENFCPANGTTLLRINALQARPRRTGTVTTPDTPGMPPVSLFIGKIFGWSFMSTRARAIATINPIIGPYPTCFPTCSQNTPLKTEWDYDNSSNDPSNPLLDPVLCSDPHLPPPNGSNTDDSFLPSPTPGLKFFAAPSSQSDPIPRPGMAWTNFDVNDCLTSPACNTSVNNQNVQPFLQPIPQEIPEICGEHICTGNLTGGNLFNVYLRNQLNNNTVQFTIGPQTISGMHAIIPIVANISCGLPHSTCPGAQEGVTNPYLVTHFLNIFLTDVVSTGQHGIRVLGKTNPRQATFTFQCKQGSNVNTYTITRWITSLNCSDCGSPLDVSGSPVRLVK